MSMINFSKRFLLWQSRDLKNLLGIVKKSTQGKTTIITIVTNQKKKGAYSAPFFF